MVPQHEVQGMMQRWTSLLPYNSIHILRVAGRADLERWRDAAAAPLAELGLPPVEAITKYAELIPSILAELNKPFAAGESPLRFFAADGGSGDHHLGVTFDHWIADSESVRFLMRRIFENYKTPGSASQLPPLRVCEKPFVDLFGRATAAEVIAESVRNYWRHRRAYRIRVRQPLDFSCGIHHLQLPEGLIKNLRQSSRRQGVSVNDLFLAAAAQALGRHTAADRSVRRKRLFRPNRDCVALSTAMDIRPLARVPLDDEF